VRDRLIDEKGEHIEGIIAECNNIKTANVHKQIYQDLYSVQRTIEDIRGETIMAADSEDQDKLLKRLHNLTYDSSWNVVKFR
jgi:nitrate reductase NapAB chaperone NapD